MVLLMTDEAMVKYKCAPLMGFAMRQQLLEGTSLVDEIFPCHGPDTYCPEIRRLRPAFFVHGSDWKTGAQENARAKAFDAAAEVDCSIVEPEYTRGVSSTLLRSGARSNALSTTISLTTAQMSQIGTNLRVALNDLKRPVHIAADELEIGEDDLQMVLNGEATAAMLWMVISNVIRSYPVRMSDIWVDSDDTLSGVVVKSRQAALSSSRTTNRKNKDGDMTAYYEYRDSAMSRLSFIKPEWIRELRNVSDSDPNNPDVAFNNGHFMAQTTFFIGPVNFYYEVNGTKYCFESETGDTNYISPFIPHSFTNRDPSRMALIIAVTFCGTVQQCSSDLAMLNSEKLHAFNVGGSRGGGGGDQRVTQRRLRLQRMMRSERWNDDQTVAVVAAAAAGSSVTKDRIDALVRDGADPTLEEAELLANVFSVPKAHFFAEYCTDDDLVVTKRFIDSERVMYPSDASPSYDIRRLARSKAQPFLKTFVINVLPTTRQTAGAPLCVDEYQFLYNYGNVLVRLEWGESFERSALIGPAGSASVLPMVQHRLSVVVVDNDDDAANGRGGHADLLDDCVPSEDGSATLVSVSVPGRLQNDFFCELSCIDEPAARRVAHETLQWYQGR
jgi:methylphosphonate synthase